MENSVSPPLSVDKHSINNGYSNHNGYPSYASDDDEDAKNNLKFSLAHYFSTTFVVFIAAILIASIVLFIWSNTSNGAWVSLQVTPVLPSDSDQTNSIQSWFPFALSKLNTNNSTQNNHKSLIYLLNELSQTTDDFEKLSLLLSTNTNITLSPETLQNLNDISDLELNLNIFSFTLVSSVSDFWQAGGYALAILIAAFSGIWPYIKLILLVVCWFLPMRQENREGIIIFLDQMGKFSFIDLFVSLYMVVSFYVTITEGLKGYGLNIKVVVEPDIGLNTFVIGTAMSMIFSHYFLFLDAKYAKPHIKQLMKQQRIENENENERNAGSGDDVFNDQIKNDLQMQYEIDDDSSSNDSEFDMKYHKYGPLFLKHMPSSVFGVFVRATALIAMIYTFYGCFYSVFTAPVRYDITGLVGFFITNPVRSYSPWDIVSEVPTKTDETSAAYPLALCLFLTIIFFPILLNALFLIIWYVPMRYKYLNYINILMQTCMAWSALDVFAVASIAASLELSRVSQWILNQNYAAVCGPGGVIPNIMETLIGTPVGCFTVSGYLVWGIGIVIAVSLCSWIAFVYTIQQLYQYKKFKNKISHKSIADKTIFFFNH